jgi:DNA-binding Lrp family transcriptional regulator
MPSSAYVLIEAAAGRIHRIMEELRKIPEVKSCEAVTGQYDLIVLVEAQDMNALGRVSYAKIQMIDGVLRTITCNIVQLD